MARWLIVAMTWFVVGSAPRSQAVAIAENIEVAEYATLPDDESYPAALAAGARRHTLHRQLSEWRALGHQQRGCGQRKSRAAAKELDR